MRLAIAFGDYNDSAMHPPQVAATAAIRILMKGKASTRTLGLIQAALREKQASLEGAL